MKVDNEVLLKARKVVMDYDAAKASAKRIAPHLGLQLPLAKEVIRISELKPPEPEIREVEVEKIVEKEIPGPERVVTKKTTKTFRYYFIPKLSAGERWKFWRTGKLPVIPGPDQHGWELHDHTENTIEG